MRHKHRFLLLIALLAASACSGNPQTLPIAQPGFGDLVRSRADLEQRLLDQESALASSQYSGDEERRVRNLAEAIRQRLEYGDFRVGDRILLSVQGEASLPDTVIVGPDQTIDLPLFGRIPVAGVLRSEITARLTSAFGAFIRDPVVRASGLVRVSLIGAVGQPGFYTMPAETVLGDAIMLAGGPSSNANLEQVRTYRGPEQIMSGEQSRIALQQGWTLDQLNLQGGDQVRVPERRGFLTLLSIVTGVIGSLSFLLWFIL